MNFLPFEDFTIESPLTPEEVQHKLAEITSPPSQNIFQFSWGRDDKEFTGILTGNSFELRRIIHYRNSFIPIIKGTIKSSTSGACIHIRMRLHELVIAFMLFWLGTVGMFALGFTPAMILAGEYLGAIVPVGMLIFAYSICIIGFKVEVAKAINRLNQLFPSSGFR